MSRVHRATAFVVAKLLGIHRVIGGLNPGRDVCEAFIDGSANAGFDDVWLVPVLRQHHKFITKGDPEGFNLLGGCLIQYDDKFITTEATDDGTLLIGLRRFP